MKKELQFTRKFAVLLLIFSFLVQTAIPIVIYAKDDKSIIYSVEDFKTKVKEGESVKLKGYIKDPWKISNGKGRKITNFELSDELQSDKNTGIPVEYSKSFEDKNPKIYEKNKNKLVVIEGTKKKYYKQDGLKDIKSITAVDLNDEKSNNTIPHKEDNKTDDIINDKKESNSNLENNVPNTEDSSNKEDISTDEKKT